MDIKNAVVCLIGGACIAECTENISFVRGDSYTAKLFLYKTDSKEPYMLGDGDVGQLMVFDACGRAVIRKQFSRDDQSEDGGVQIAFLPADTENIAEPYLCYEIEIQTSDGDVFTLLYGEFVLVCDMITPDIRTPEGSDC